MSLTARQGSPKQNVPGNCFSSFLIHPPLNRSNYLNILRQKALRAGHNCCKYSVWVLQHEQVLSPAVGYSQNHVRVVDFDSPFPKAGKAWADLCPALASWACIMACSLQIFSKAHGCALNISCASTSSNLHRTPLLYFCITPLHRNGAATMYSEEKNIP